MNLKKAGEPRRTQRARRNSKSYMPTYPKGALVKIHKRWFFLCVPRVLCGELSLE
jgi:hypothetical protein